MCQNCWIEEGSHSIINERTKKGSDLISAIYNTEDGGAGGYAHIVVDDENLEDYHIESCLNEINNPSFELCKETKEACLECLLYLKSLSIEERWSSIALSNGYIEK